MCGNSEVAVVYYVGVGLLDENPGLEPQARHQNEIRKVFHRRFPLSRFLAKALRGNKIAMKSFSKKICRSELTLNSRSRQLCIKSCVRN